MTNADDTRGAQALMDIAQVVADALGQAKLAPELCLEIGRQAAEAVRKTYGGEQIYIPKGRFMVLTERDRQIWREFTGANAFALAKKYQVTERHIYRIVALMRAEEFAARQLQMFG